GTISSAATVAALNANTITNSCVEGQSPKGAQMPYRPPARQRLRRRDDRLGVDAIVPVEIADRTGLAEMLDPERAHAVTGDGAEPGERRRMTVEHGDDAAMRRHVVEQPLHMRARMDEAALARPL